MSVRAAAEKCELPAYRLRDIIYRKVQHPDAEILAGISRGLGIPYEQLALAAYGIIHDPAEPQEWDDTAPLEEAPPADSNNGHEWKRAGPRPKAVSAAT